MWKRDYSSNLETASRHTSSLVFEFGQAFVRVGIAGESAPRVVIPIISLHQEDEEESIHHSFWKSNFSIVGNSNKQYCTSCAIVLDNTKNHLWNANDDDDDDDTIRTGRLLPWLSNLYTYQLFIKPKSRRVVVIFPVSYPPKLQYQLQKTLLKDLEVPAVYFTHVFHAIPYAIGSRAGIIIDIGQQEARMVAFFDGIMSEETLQIIPFGYANCIRILASQRNKTREQIIKDLHSPDEETITILYSDYLFNLHLHDSIVYAFLTMLSKCSIDLRRCVLESVSFVGGGIKSLPNFEKEFVKHLLYLYEKSPSEASTYPDGSALQPSSRYPYRVKDRNYARFDCLGMSIMSWMNVIQLKFHPASMAWVGGSIMASIKNDRMKWIQSTESVQD